MPNISFRSSYRYLLFADTITQHYQHKNSLRSLVQLDDMAIYGRQNGLEYQTSLF